MMSKKGKSERVIGGPGGAFRPQISPDGKKLAYLKRIRTKTVLGIYDLATGTEHFIFDNLSKDQQEAWAIFGVYSGFDWTPDGEHIVISGMGKIWKVNVTSKEALEIPFEAEVSMKVAETIKFRNEAYEDEFQAKVIRHAVTSPDEKKLLFNAVGHLWMMDLPNGKPKRVTKDTDFEFEPAFSKDGKSIVYVTWDDEKMGSVIKMDLRSKRKTTLSKTKGIYRTPQFSNDGQKVVFRKDGGNMHQGFVHTKNPGIYITNATGTMTPKKISDSGSFPVFGKDDKRVYYQTGGYIFGSLTKSYESVNLHGEDKKEHFNGKYAQRYVISPDNNWIAWSELFKVYVAPFPKTGKKGRNYQGL